MQPLIEMLEDQDMLVRLEAVLALGHFSDNQIIEPLIEALKSNWYQVRYSASQVLQRMTRQNFDQDYAKWKKWWEVNKSDYRLKRKLLM